MIKYPLVRIGDIVTVRGGKRLPKGEDFSLFPTAHPYIRAQDIGQGKIQSNDSVYISDEIAQKLKNYTVNTNDVCIVIVGANVGDVGIVPSHLNGVNLTENAVKLTIPSSDCDLIYLKYSLLWDESQKQMKLMAGGSAQPKLGIYKVNEIKIPLPHLFIQKKIASILSTFDKLIENNTRRIQILEEMAQAIYREWFVHFRYPGHAGARMVESEMGEMPEGWEVRKLGQVCKITMGQSPESKFYNENGEGLPFHQGVTHFGGRFPKDKVYCTVELRTAERGDILCSVRAPVGRLNIAATKIVIGRGLCSIRSTLKAQNFTYQQLKEIFQEEDSMGSGTIFKAVTKDDMLRINVLVPNNSLLIKFEEIIGPLSNLIEKLYKKNDNLRQQRDLLLPRLVSGELDVKRSTS